MKMKKAHARAAAFFAAANVLAGVIYYFFQVWSASRLSVIEFGELNSWIAYFSIVLSLGAFAQYGANFFIASPRILRLASWICLVIAVLGLATPWLLPHSGGVFIGFVGALIGVIFSWCMGQAQARLAFSVMGIGVLLTGIAKFALAAWDYPAEGESMSLAWAVALAYAPGLIWMAGILVLKARAWRRAEDPDLDVAKGLGATAILSFASVMIPQLDVIAIHQTQADEVIGRFARISLLYKAVFFSFLILAQWLLPHQMAEKHRRPRIVTWMAGSRWHVLGLGMALAAGAAASGLLVASFFMSGISENWLWLALSCLNMAWLTNLFFTIQLDCVEQKLSRALTILAALAVELGVAIGLKLPVTRYLLYAVTANMILWFTLTRDPRRAH
jgi:hypothetical protein